MTARWLKNLKSETDRLLAANVVTVVSISYVCLSKQMGALNALRRKCGDSRNEHIQCILLLISKMRNKNDSWNCNKYQEDNLQLNQNWLYR